MTATPVAGEVSEPGIGERCESARSGQLPMVIANPRRKRKKRLMLAANPARFQRSPSGRPNADTAAPRSGEQAETAILQAPKSGSTGRPRQSTSPATTSSGDP